jgi:hypothetical protein
MYDLQTVYYRDLAPVLAFDFVTMMSISDVATGTLRQVLVGGLPTPFIVQEAGVVLARLPNNARLADVTSIELLHQSSDGLFTEAVVATAGVDDGDSRVKEGVTVLSLQGRDFSKATEVLIENASQPFTIVSKTEVLASMPERLYVNRTADFSIDVVVSTTTVDRTTFFRYTIGNEIRSVSGGRKLVNQFLKVLMTSPGSDAFNPNGAAGNLQNWVGVNASGGPNARSAMLMVSIQRAATKMVAAMSRLDLPPEERLQSVEILNVDADVRRGTMTVSLRVNSFGQQQATFGFTLGTIQQLIQQNATPG